MIPDELLKHFAFLPFADIPPVHVLIVPLKQLLRALFSGCQIGDLPIELIDVLLVLAAGLREQLVTIRALSLEGL